MGWEHVVLFCISLFGMDLHQLLKGPCSIKDNTLHFHFVVQAKRRKKNIQWRLGIRFIDFVSVFHNPKKKYFSVAQTFSAFLKSSTASFDFTLPQIVSTEDLLLAHSMLPTYFMSMSRQFCAAK